MSAIDPRAQWREAELWMAYAERDIRSAHALLALAPPETENAAYLTQQAAEKLLKATLIARAKAFPKTHDIEDLADRVTAEAPELKPAVAALTPAQDWDIAHRYPAPGGLGAPPPAVSEVMQVLRAAEHYCAVLSGLAPR